MHFNSYYIGGTLRLLGEPMSKGSRPRPFSISQEEFGNRIDGIFGKKPPRESYVYKPDDEVLNAYNDERLVSKFDKIELCACMGKIGNDPECPCVMRQMGLTPSDGMSVAEQAQLREVMTQFLNKENK